MFKSISMAWRPGLQILQEGLAKEECSKEHFKKFIIQSSSWFHKMLVSNDHFSKSWFQVLISQNVHKVQVFHQSSQNSQNVGFKCSFHKILVSRVDFSKCQVLKIMDFLKCSRASQWHGVPDCKFCKRVSPKRNAQKNISKNSLFKVHHGFTKCWFQMIISQKVGFKC